MRRFFENIGLALKVGRVARDVRHCGELRERLGFTGIRIEDGLQRGKETALVIDRLVTSPERREK